MSCFDNTAERNKTFPMNSENNNEILPGLSVDAAGQVSVDKQMGELLFDLAIALEDTVSEPVDVEHVLAAIILAARAGQIDPSTSLSTGNAEFLTTLRVQLQAVFDQCGGDLQGDDS